MPTTGMMVGLSVPSSQHSLLMQLVLPLFNAPAKANKFEFELDGVCEGCREPGVLACGLVKATASRRMLDVGLNTETT